MIALSHFTRLADRQGVDAKTIERDYVLTHIVAGIYRQPGSNDLAFKGGTVLRLCYFDDYRYSADLDFSLTGGRTPSAALELVVDALEVARGAHDLPALELNDAGDRITYVGPLGRQHSLKLDLAADELVEETTTTPLLARYPDQPETDIVAYTLDEIAAEKLRCVIQRVQARDLYDLHQLFVSHRLDVDDIWPAFERKAIHKSLDPDRFPDMFDKRMPAWEQRWDTEMEDHVAVGDRPQFNRVERTVRRALRSHLVGHR